MTSPPQPPPALSSQNPCLSSSSSSSGHHTLSSSSNNSSLDDNNSSSPSSSVQQTTSSFVTLNVGGTTFLTTKTTLQKDPKSFLARLIDDRNDLVSCKDPSGALLIDRDPQYFAPVLNFLRHGKLVLNKDIAEEGVLEEAEFYGVVELIKLLKERIQRNKMKAEGRIGTQHVYRVFNCLEEELTQIVSGLSDGWRFEQLIPITSPAGLYSNSEFLCVVSREVVDSNDTRGGGGGAQVNGDSSGNSGISDRGKLLQQRGSRM